MLLDTIETLQTDCRKLQDEYRNRKDSIRAVSKSTVIRRRYVIEEPTRETVVIDKVEDAVVTGSVED